MSNNHYMTDFFLNLRARRKFEDVYNGEPAIHTPGSMLQHYALATNCEEEIKKTKKMFYMAWYFTACREMDKKYLDPSGDHSNYVFSINDVMNTMIDFAGVDETENILLAGYAAAAVSKIHGIEPGPDGQPSDSILHNLYTPGDFILFVFDLFGTFESLFDRGDMFHGDNSRCDWTVAYYSGEREQTKVARHLVIYNQYAQENHMNSLFDVADQESDDDRPYLKKDNIVARHIDDIDIEFAIKPSNIEFANMTKMTSFRPYNFPDFDGKNQKMIDEIREMIDINIDEGLFVPYCIFFNFYSKGNRVITIPVAPRFFDNLNPLIKEKMAELENSTKYSKAICPFTMNVETSATLDESKLDKEMSRVATLISATVPPDTWSYEKIHDKTMLRNIIFSSPDAAMEHFELFHFLYQDDPKVIHILTEDLEEESDEDDGGDED